MFFALIGFTVACFLGDAPKMSTAAGTGMRGHTGDGGLATKATLSEPFHCELDGKGNLYVAESANHCIRKVHLKTGIISTVAGNGKKGYSGDGGKATDANLVEPNDCILDGKGGLLIADVGDWRIRRLDLSTGIISTFAGTGRAKIPAKMKIDRAKCGDDGPAHKAIVVGARAVCVDGKGNTYICEREGSAVRKVDAKGTITTIAGTGEWGYKGDKAEASKAVFAGPKGIRCDADGNIFVVDCENHCIRRIDAKTMIVTTVAGGRKGKQDGPATEAGMDRPHGCIIAADGTIYIADSNNHRVRVVK